MSSSATTLSSLVDTPAFRQAGREPLSLALMDARNHTLHLLGLCEAHGAGLDGRAGDPLWLAGRAGWFAESWIGRNPQRHQGAACPQRPTRLVSSQPQADLWWGEAAEQGADVATTRAFLLEQLESTLELLDKAPQDDAGLYFYRLAVLHEDLRGEDMLVQAQRLGVPVPLLAREPRRPGAALAMPATRWRLGARASGLVLDNEQGSHVVQIPEFEIDAQPVSWAQFVEFVDDGGYDRAELWHPDGWAWLAREQALDEGRRGPRYVEQIGVASGAVLQQRFGRPVRMASHHPAMHVSWWEADAWCRWAGRRLPAEAEWEYTVSTAARRGFDWGGVHEWMAGTLQPWPGFVAGPWAGYSAPAMGHARALRGASFATRARLHDPVFRGFAQPDDDARFVGFRSCAL
jgi:formylglycine-generating enzyme required for sulfatase activity